MTCIPIEYLEKLQQFTQLPDHQLEKIKPSLKLQTVPHGEHLDRSGDIPVNLAFIIQGLFRYYYITLDGDDMTKSFRGEGEFIGAYSALVQRKAMDYSIEALEDSELLIFPFDTFIRLSQSDFHWQRFHLKMLERLYLIKEQRERDLLLYDAQTRYLAFLEAYPGIEQRVKQYHIATYLGITPVSLSRIRQQLKRESEKLS